MPPPRRADARGPEPADRNGSQLRLDVPPLPDGEVLLRARPDYLSVEPEQLADHRAQQRRELSAASRERREDMVRALGEPIRTEAEQYDEDLAEFQRLRHDNHPEYVCLVAQWETDRRVRAHATQGTIGVVEAEAGLAESLVDIEEQAGSHALEVGDRVAAKRHSAKAAELRALARQGRDEAERLRAGQLAPAEVDRHVFKRQRTLFRATDAHVGRTLRREHRRVECGFRARSTLRDRRPRSGSRRSAGPRRARQGSGSSSSGSGSGDPGGGEPPGEPLDPFLCAAVSLSASERLRLTLASPQLDRALWREVATVARRAA